MPTKLFDHAKLLKNRRKSSSIIREAEFYNFIADDLIERLSSIDKEYSNILLLADRGSLVETRLQEDYQPQSAKKKPTVRTEQIVRTKSLIQRNATIKIVEDWLRLDFVEQQLNSDLEQKNGFDLIIFPFSLHWVSDVQGFLKKLANLLAPEGILIANFAGGHSLRSLRRYLLELEIKYSQIGDSNQQPNSSQSQVVTAGKQNSTPEPQHHSSRHQQHISPFISFEHIVPLLQAAEFKEIVSDMEQIELEYAGPLQLMHALKSAGEGNVLSNHVNYSINQQMYNEICNSSCNTDDQQFANISDNHKHHDYHTNKETQAIKGKFIDYIYLITFIASKSRKAIKVVR